MLYKAKFSARFKLIYSFVFVWTNSGEGKKYLRSKYHILLAVNLGWCVEQGQMIQTNTENVKVGYGHGYEYKIGRV